MASTALHQLARRECKWHDSSTALRSAWRRVRSGCERLSRSDGLCRDAWSTRCKGASHGPACTYHAPVLTARSCLCAWVPVCVRSRSYTKIRKEFAALRKLVMRLSASADVYKYQKALALEECNRTRRRLAQATALLAEKTYAEAGRQLQPGAGENELASWRRADRPSNVAAGTANGSLRDAPVSGLGLDALGDLSGLQGLQPYPPTPQHVTPSPGGAGSHGSSAVVVATQEAGVASPPTAEALGSHGSARRPATATTAERGASAVRRGGRLSASDLRAQPTATRSRTRDFPHW